MMNETDTRVLVAARLSRLVKGRDQLSIERQDDAASRYAAEVGDSSPLLAPDAGVSGSVSPFKRPKLGPWLTDEHADEWDELVASAIDRLGRNARDLAELRAWCEDHGKRITILSPRLHWPPAQDDFSSPIVWAVLEALAEIELRQTKKRYADTRQFIRDRKSVLGHPCWGFKITGPKLAKTITPDPTKVPTLLKMVELAEHGQSIADIARWLDDEGIKPIRSKTWSPKSVGQILRNESLYGVYRESGKILLHHQGIISKERWDALQVKLDANPKRRGPTRNDPAMLTDVLYCAKCEAVMHARRTNSRPRKDGSRYVWVGYRCDHTKLGEDEKTGRPILADKSTCENMVRADDIEPWVDEWFTVGPFKDVEIMETVHIPAKGYADEVAELETQIRELDLDSPDYDETHAALRAERARLLALGTEPAHTEDRPTGILVGDYWPTLGGAGKRDYLRRSGVKVYAASKTADPDSGGMNARIVGNPYKVIGALKH